MNLKKGMLVRAVSNWHTSRFLKGDIGVIIEIYSNGDVFKIFEIAILNSNGEIRNISGSYGTIEILKKPNAS